MGAEAATIAVNGAFLGQVATGVQRYAWEMLRALAAEAPRFKWLLFAPGRAAARATGPTVHGEPGELPPGIERVFDGSRLPRAIWMQLRLPALVRRAGAALLWSPANIGPLAVRRQVLTIFDASVYAHPEWFSPAFRAYYRLVQPALARRVARVATISEFSRGELAAHGIKPAAQTAVTGCGVSPAFHPGADPGRWAALRPYVLSVASRDPRKNAAALLRAWASLPRSLTEGRRLLLAGGGAAAFAPERLGELPAGAQLLGFVPEKELPGLYAGAEAFAYLSLYEGFGLPPLEAMASGAPALVSRAASLPEVCGDAALYCDPLEPESVAKGLESILTDAPLRARLQAAGRDRAALFTWKRAADRLLGVFDEILA